MTIEAQPSKLLSIQALRAYAAISVMVAHAAEEWASTFKGALGFNTHPLTFGVDVFFVISGFIMYYTSSRMFGEAGAPAQFFKRRLMRIVPLYWFFTTLMLLTLIFFSSGVNSTELEPWNAVASYLFFPAERASGRIAPILSLGWTLNYEMMFYVIFSVVLLLPRRLGVIALIAALTALVVFGLVFHPALTPLRFWSDPVILEFAAGVLLGVMHAHRPRSSAIMSLLCLAIGAAALTLQMFVPETGLHRVIAGGVPACFLVGGALLLPAKLDAAVPRFISLIGDSSYALYLCHRFVLRVVTILAGHFLASGAPGVWLYVAIVTGVAIVASIVVHKVIEQPVLHWLKRRTENRVRAMA